VVLFCDPKVLTLCTVEQKPTPIRPGWVIAPSTDTIAGRAAVMGSPAAPEPARVLPSPWARAGSPSVAAIKCPDRLITQRYRNKARVCGVSLRVRHVLTQSNRPDGPWENPMRMKKIERTMLPALAAAGCAVVLGASIMISPAQAANAAPAASGSNGATSAPQQTINPPPTPPGPTYNSSSPNTAPQSPESPVSPETPGTTPGSLSH
jgi:hypothetical protein